MGHFIISPTTFPSGWSDSQILHRIIHLLAITPLHPIDGEFFVNDAFQSGVTVFGELSFLNCSWRYKGDSFNAPELKELVEAMKENMHSVAYKVVKEIEGLSEGLKKKPKDERRTECREIHKLQRQADYQLARASLPLARKLLFSNFSEVFIISTPP